MLLTKEFQDLTLKKKKIENPALKDLYLFTVSHKTAPIPIREKFAIPECSLKETYQNPKKYKSLKAFLILSTCSRTEIYFVSDNLEQSINEIYIFLNASLNIEQRVAKEYSSVISNIEVINHAFKLASGLDSLVIGEKQILSQVKEAYFYAQKEKTLNKTLELLFQKIIQTAKEVHKNTNISKSSQSISSAAVELANKIAGPLKTKQVMVLGAGRMAKLVLEHILKISGSKETVVLNKSPHRIIEFPYKYKIDRSVPFENVYETMNDVDIVIAATGAPHFIIFAEQFNKVRKNQNKELFIFDISMPRNIDSEFGKLPNVHLYDIDSLQTIYNQTTTINIKDLSKTEEMIQEGKNKFIEQISNQSVQLLIKELKEKVEKIRTEKLMKFNSSKSTFTAKEVEYITRNIINSIFHTPITNLKDSTGSIELKIVKKLFDI